EGVATHEHREWIPILENDQDMTRLAGRVRHVLAEHEGCHAFLLRRHGLYTWGETLPQAVRHVEILEFLLEAVGRTESRGGMSWPSGGFPLKTSCSGSPARSPNSWRDMRSTTSSGRPAPA